MYAEDAPTLFDADTSIAISLEGPMTEIARDHSADPAYRDVTLILEDGAANAVRIPLKMRPRGKSRRSASACRFPPLRLNFPKHGPQQATAFSNLDKIKLVTHCARLGSSNAAYAARVRLELQLYRVFSRLSPTSLRVRAVDVTYVDTSRANTRNTHVGFLIEPIEVLADRVGMTVARVDSIEREDLDAGQANLVEMFEYLVGNTDFSMIRGPIGEHCCHNVELLRAANGAMFPVPYDFDATGVVGAPYAKPVASLGIRTVRQRLYRGYCREDSVVNNTLAVFRDAQSDVYALFRDDARLERRTADKTLAYFDEFYATINHSEALQSKLLSHCI